MPASVSNRTAIGSIPDRAVITSEIVAPDSSSRSPAGRATISGPGTRTRAPVREPRRTSTSRSDSSTRTASRRVGLLTPKWAISSASLGRKSPSLSWPSTTMRRSVPATSSAVFGDRIGAPPTGATASGPIIGANGVLRATTLP